jgi:uncharacterized protein DUF3592
MESALRQTREATGIVIDVVHESVNKKGRMHPVVRYRTADGAEVVGRSERHYTLQPGEQVQIVYDVHDPEQIEIGTLAQARHRIRVIAGAAVAIGIASILAGVGLHLGFIRPRRSEER